MKYISLFSGIGGFDLAFQNAGMECDTVCEINKDAQNVLRRHFPNAKLVDDVRKIGLQTHGRNSIDIICGGFPCQDLSIAGKRAGLAGERSGLWFEFARIIDELEPQWVVIENVPGLLSSNRGADFAVIIQWLAKRGYGVCWRVLDAQYFGVPQRRRRVFIVASFGDGRAAEVLFERESGAGNIEQSGETRERFTGAVIKGAAIGRKPSAGPQYGEILTDGTCYTLNCTETHVVMAHGQANAEIVKDGSPSLTLNHEAPILFDGRNMATHEQSPTLQAKSTGGYSLNYTPMVIQQNTRDEVRYMGGDGHYAGALSAQPGMKQQNYLLWHNHQQDGSIRIQDDDTAPTVSRQWGTGGNNVPFVGVRRLMPIECERLQGFPDGWTEIGLENVQLYGNIAETNLRRLLSCAKNVQFRDAIGNLLTGKMGSASCTINVSKDTNLSICLKENSQKEISAKYVKAKLEIMGREDFAESIINHGSVTVIRCNRKKITKIEKGTEKVSLENIGMLWKISLAENYSQENLYIISTWIKQIIRLITYTSAMGTGNTCAFIVLWKKSFQNLCEEKSFSLTMDVIESQSDSARYRQLGNAVAVPVVEWIGRRIMEATK